MAGGGGVEPVIGCDGRGIGEGREGGVVGLGAASEVGCGEVEVTAAGAVQDVTLVLALDLAPFAGGAFECWLCSCQLSFSSPSS